MRRFYRRRNHRGEKIRAAHDPRPVTARIPCPFTSVVTTRAMLEKEPLLLGDLLKEFFTA
jgi:hypothetical protein